MTTIKWEIVRTKDDAIYKTLQEHNFDQKVLDAWLTYGSYQDETVSAADGTVEYYYCPIHERYHSYFFFADIVVHKGVLLGRRIFADIDDDDGSVSEEEEDFLSLSNSLSLTTFINVFVHQCNFNELMKTLHQGRKCAYESQ